MTWLNQLRKVRWRKAAIFLLALFLFVLSIQLLKSSARVLVPVVRDHLAVTSLPSALGLGWLTAYLVLSGSPVAATALAFLDAGVVDRLGAFGMIAGSRLGASFFVLLLGFVYSLRGHDRTRSLAMGLLSLIVSAAVQLPALAIGYWLLQADRLNWLPGQAPAAITSVMEWVFDPIVAQAQALLPLWAVFGLGFGVLWYSLNLIDHALPDMHLKESAFGGMARLLYRPPVTFALGMAVTTLTMSVSVSLTLLVPLSTRSYIRRENVVPYIMGASITTLVDTLLAALLLRNPAAVAVVLAQMIGVFVVSMLILVFFYRPFERGVVKLVDIIGQSRRNLAIFLAVLMGVPLALIFWG